ncbi:MAG TPA: caspase family protein [Pirellulales bacterium]|nr:caspase family protein [Pirellulales bacterium]
MNDNRHFMARRRVACVYLSLCVATASLASKALGQTPEAPHKPSGRQAAMLIGVEKYQKVQPLAFIGNDVQRLAHTLRTRGSFDEVWEISDTAPAASIQPLRQTLMSRLPEWLADRKPDDTVIVYFSGHGFRSADGTMYLAPLDVDPADLNGTGVPVAWFRDQIARCQAGLKLLILDACHAGSAKGEGEANLGPQDLNLFERLEGVVTLASSTADQPSQIWSEKKQSLFSYWLNQGLQGHADGDSNGEVDIDELNRYVFDNVTQTARQQLSGRQTPVRKVGLGTPGTPVVMYLTPQKLSQVLIDMAEQLGDAAASRKLDKVGVLEFTNDTKLGELLGADYGLLGRYCAEQLEDGLVREQNERFKVVNRRRLQQALQAQQFSLADLGSGEALKELGERAGGMPAVAVGMLRGRAGRMLSLRCQLIETNENDVAASVGGTAWLNESEWAMLGKSAALRRDDYAFVPPADDKPPRPQADLVVDRLDQLSKGPHPLSDSNFPYRVWIMVGGKNRTGQFRGNDYFVPLHKGEVYEIWVENRSGQRRLMRLLVDGLNTNLEKENPITVADPQADKGLATEIIGKHVNLNDARAWILDPNSPRQRRQRRPGLFAIRGFVTKTGQQGKMAQFTVVDADQSLAARQQFTDQIGLITAAFYAEEVAPRAMMSAAPGAGAGTGAGRIIEENLEEVRANVGQLLAVVNIRYYDADQPPPAGQ